MLEQQSMLDWQIGESGDWDHFQPLEWPSRPEIATSDGTDTGRRWRWRDVLHGLGLFILLAAVVIGYSYWREYQAGITRIRTDIQSTVDVEAWAWGNGDEALADSLMDSRADDGWARDFRRDRERGLHYAGDEVQPREVKIENVELQDSVALIEVLVTDPGVPWTSTPYRETRFYRQVDGRWLRTAPVADFWGSERTVETDHFRFSFHQRDAEAVETVAADVEALYTDLRQGVGLGPPPADETLAVEVVPRTDVTDWRFAEDRLTVPSPALLPVPEDHPDAARLSQSITYPLARHVLNKALGEVDIEPQWSTLVEGIHHWLTWDRESLPSGWRYHAEEPLRRQIERGRTLHLSDVTPAWSEGWNWGRRWTRLIAAETAVEYAMDTYGRDRLPALLQALSEHETWDTLIPAAFDVPREDFEAGWQAYLTARYERDAQ